ncbi:MAG: RagB/SusD family nutrient uptake outer membrane protein [Ferruginibacter sp.]|nr:RagB/SusD family nutrient uptake outer membrane protein [Ferruginibacter sp.]
MKKISFILLIAISILASSCEKDLKQIPISSPTTITFYLQPSDFIQAVNAAYNSLRGYPERSLFLSEVRSDNIYPTNDVGRDPDPINNFATGITANVYVEEAWTANFSGIFRANTALEQIAKNGGFIGNATLATRLTAEARFLRAFFYFDLVRYFGKVPIIDHPVLVNEAITIARSPVADIYAFIIADLQFAMANLPANFSGTFPGYGPTDVGRATKYAAEAMLAKVYMSRSGPTYGIEGPGLGLSEWNLALPLLQDIITNGGFVFNPNFSGGTGIFSYTNQNPSVNKEAVFDVIYLTGQTNPVLGAVFPWQLVPQNYFNAYGNPSTSGALGTPSVSNDLLNSYAATDTRKSPTIHTTPYTYTGTTETKPFFRKYLDTTRVPLTRFDWGINFIAIRYTDILMLKAECILRGGTPGTQADVDAIVNQVRARGAQPAISNVTLAQLFDERRKEFAAEGLRWFDLQRSGNLITIMNAWRTVEDAALKKMNPITANAIIYPVPQTQLDAAPGLYAQNPGY